MSSLQQVQKTIDACRFCWMCRHVCPIGLQTAKEINGPRGRALVLSSILHGKKIDREVAEVVYECSLCGACVNQCVTGYDPTVFTRVARSEIVSMGLAPENVQRIINNLLENGNPFGLAKAEKSRSYEDLIDNLPEKADVLLYIGCTAAYLTPEIARAAIELLKKAKINFTVLRKEECCGSYLNDLIGTVAETKQQAENLAAQIKQTGAKTLVALCPSGTRIFKREYLEWNIELPPEVKSITSFLAELIAQNKLKPRPLSRKVTFHDPCRLARDLEESEPAREILRSLGFEIKEMFRNKNNTNCCGSGLLNEYAPELVDLTSKSRWEEALRTKADDLIVACPSCKHILAKTKPEGGMELRDLVEILYEQCRDE